MSDADTVNGHRVQAVDRGTRRAWRCRDCGQVYPTRRGFEGARCE